MKPDEERLKEIEKGFNIVLKRKIKSKLLYLNYV